MATERLYLDYNATAPVRPEVIARMGEILRDPGNASSIHGFGRDARKHVESAREQVAALAGVKPAQVIFTSGATESNNTVLAAFADKSVLVSAIEHPSVLEAAPRAPRIPVTAEGVIDLAAFEKLLAEHSPALVSVQYVNNETGAIQPVAEIARLAHAKSALVHTDAVQAAGRIPIDFKTLGVDFMSLTAHKLAGPQGVGALIVRENLPVKRFMHGGGQERRQRAGTENVAGIAGFGLAARLAADHLSSYAKLADLRDDLERRLKQLCPEAVIYGANTPRVANTTCVGLPGLSAETQLMALDLDGIAVGSGSACSSGTFKPSHVLAAMGADENACKSALRISTGWATQERDMSAFLDAWDRMRQRMKR